MKRQGLFVAALTLAGAFQRPVQARPAASEVAADEICVSVAVPWIGSATEREKILETPVPDSFQRRFNDTGCARYQLIEESLLDWHLKYGNQQSARTAIQYLEKNTSPRIDPKANQAFIRHWQIAREDVRRRIDAAKSKSPGKSDEEYLAGIRQDIQSRRSITDLLKDHETLSGYDFVAREYARAAEFYLSPVLVADAERFQRPTYALSRFVDEQTKVGAIEAYLAEIAGLQSYRDRMTPAAREIALAVTKAAIGRDEATIRAADALTRARYAAGSEKWKYSDLLTFVENAYVYDDDACNPDNRNSIDGYRERCESDGFEEDAFSFWFNRSRLELIAQKAGVKLEPLDIPFPRDGATPKTIDLFVRRDWEKGDSRYSERIPAPEIVRLLVWSADAIAHSDSCAALAADDDLRFAYERLIWAQTLVNPAKDPRTYHLIAENFLRHYEAAKACGRTDTNPTNIRDALIFRSFLADYKDLIAVE